jgi:hypothetical protein
MLKIHKSLLVVFAFASLVSCKPSEKAQTGNISNNQSQTSDKQSLNMALPPTYIYKTRKDYSQLVPVLVSATTKEIYAYPDKKDLLLDGKLRQPSQLIDGYLLDNKGLSKDAAFLKLTYAQYVALDHTPTAKELQELIIDNEPFTELYQCKKNLHSESKLDYFNQLIQNGQLQKECVRIK